MNVGPLLVCLHDAEQSLGQEYRVLAERHASDHDVYHQCDTFSKQCDKHVGQIAPFVEKYDGRGDAGVWGEPVESIRERGSADDGLALLGDMRTLYLAAEEVLITWVMAEQSAQALRDRELLAVVRECHQDTELQVKWLTTRIKVGSPQALVAG